MRRAAGDALRISRTFVWQKEYPALQNLKLAEHLLSLEKNIDKGNAEKQKFLSLACKEAQ
jgi:hypothetical protein